ncbi:thiamine pyrophosphate-binding protein [Synechococcus sp. MIT S9451]|uniref:thiamine pyrophosphate-binding protein n=1 Tax=Synechococcus sp. MIT S9451 TaxID=3082543 RepID=UPI0039B56058
MRCADWIISRLNSFGCTEVFGVTGGAVVHLFDAAEINPSVNVSYFNHEQSASFAAEAFSKFSSTLSACIVTTGPGATNALTGLAAAWLDSIPMIFISGQARSNNIISSRPLRQVGTQEVDIVSMVSSMTKSCEQITSIRQLVDSFDAHIHNAYTGRPGPIWLDICVDVLWSEMNDEHLLAPPPPSLPSPPLISANFFNNILPSLFKKSRRPLLLMGGGCRNPVIPNLSSIISSIGIPFVTTWLGYDLVDTKHPLHMGHIGMSGQRGANLLVGNTDLLICVGSSVSNSVTSTIISNFAPNAIRVNVNIDPKDFSHTFNFFHYNIEAPATQIFQSLVGLSNNFSVSLKWLEFSNKCKHLSYNEAPPPSKFVHPFNIFRSFNEYGPEDLVFVVDGGGTSVYSSFQCLMPSPKRRLILSTGLCSMGSGLPEALGVSRSGLPVVLFCGDGSFPFNVQELQAVHDKNLPILYIIFSNNAYLSIRSTQTQFLDSRHVGSKPPDVHLLDIKSISEAFSIQYSKVDSLQEFRSFLTSHNFEAPYIIEIPTDPNQEIQPRQSFKQTNGQYSPNPLTLMDPPLNSSIQNELNIFQSDFKLIQAIEKDLLLSYPQSTSSRSTRISTLQSESLLSVSDIVIREKMIREARLYEKEYFDGNRLYGYGGYYYHPRFWTQVAVDIKDYFCINNQDSILELGCAKGFLLYDLQTLIPEVQLTGLDISTYALDNKHPPLNAKLINKCISSILDCSCQYDYILAINTISELPADLLVPVLASISRLSVKSSYINLLTWNSESEKRMIDSWNITSQSILTKHEWFEIMSKAKYAGHYSFTTLSF